MSVLAAGAAWLASFMLSHLAKSFNIGIDDHLGDKPQRFHQHQVCRLGGLGIMAGIGVYALLSFPAGTAAANILEPFPVWVVFVGLPVFALGFIEDCRGSLSARQRLAAAFVSALVAAFLLKAVLPIPGNSAYWVGFLCWIFTCFCVAGVTHAFNIIDGLNGLASGIAVIVLAGLGWIAHGLGDLLLLQLSVGTIAAILGFMLVNFPFGRIFLGDGGAYLIGFLVAECSVLLLVRHPEVSWFFPFALASYPVTETLYSMYRRKIKQSQAQKADALHLHSLVHRRLNRWAWGSTRVSAVRNSISTTFFWVWQGMATIVVLLIWDQRSLLIAYCVMSVGLYLGLYRMLVRFKAPRWMRIITNPGASQQEFDWR
jgi:UDP-N-acetylmuramyl pentapeptide phosphotransferase/UDP-N-acetylglucosamine-1-phosphate transferase